MELKAGYHWVKPYEYHLINRKPKYLGWTNWFPFVPEYAITFEGDDLFTLCGMDEEFVVKFVGAMNGAYNLGALSGYTNALEDR